MSLHLARAGRDGMHVCIERLAETRLIADAHAASKTVPLEALLPGELAWLADRAMDALDLESRLERAELEARVLRDAYLSKHGQTGGAS